MDTISVLMSIYHEPIEWIRLSILSILNQACRENISIQLVVILDEPKRKDEIYAFLRNIIKPKNEIIFFCNSKNIGLARSLNKAFDLSTGQYIARMDADDISHCQRFKRQIEFYEQNDYALIGCHIDKINKKGDFLSTSKLPTDDCELIARHGYKAIAYHPTWFMARKIFEKVGGYRSYPCAQDFDFLSRLLDMGYKVGNIPEVLLDYRINNASLSIDKSLRQRKCHFHILKMNKERRELMVDSFSEDSMNKYIYANPALAQLHSLSQRCLHFSTMMRHINPLRYFLLFLACIISPYQLIHVIRVLFFDFKSLFCKCLRWQKRFFSTIWV